MPVPYFSRRFAVERCRILIYAMLRLHGAMQFALPLMLTACATQPDEAPVPPDTQVHALLDAQQLAWNHGDIEGFMQGYWHDDRLRFESCSATTSGWQATHDRYFARYPDRAAMGHLQFSNVQVSAIDERSANASGGWELQRAGDSPHGTFVLDLRRFKDGWKIVKDHTESAP